ACAVSSLFLFFQAEDGIRDFHVTGVQTCALPILVRLMDSCTKAVVKVNPNDAVGQFLALGKAYLRWAVDHRVQFRLISSHPALRSEERRVGKECRCPMSAEQDEKHVSRSSAGCSV